MTSQQSLIKFGFKFGKNGAHAARTMMLAELQELFAYTPVDAGRDQYREQIVDFNRLDKPTSNARVLTYGHLLDLYGMSPEVPLFRVFRTLWEQDSAARPVLALQLAMARDPILRLSVATILERQPGQPLTREETEAALAAPDPQRFKATTLKSAAQCVNGSWTQAGYLKGRVKKHRDQPVITASNVAFALFQGYLHGLSGQRLFASEWCKLLDCRLERLLELARTASQRGLITFKHSSEVIEVDFPDFLTDEERTWLNE